MKTFHSGIAGVMTRGGGGGYLCLPPCRAESTPPRMSTLTQLFAVVETRRLRYCKMTATTITTATTLTSTMTMTMMMTTTTMMVLTTTMAIPELPEAQHK